MQITVTVLRDENLEYKERESKLEVAAEERKPQKGL